MLQGSTDRQGAGDLCGGGRCRRGVPEEGASGDSCGRRRQHRVNADDVSL